MAFALSRESEDGVLLASRTALTNEFSKLKTNFSLQKWLRDTNRLNHNTANIIEAETFSDDEMKEYIAASTITHLHDAWSFFGRSIIAILNGDTVSARHMAYYSELRSAMSILATEGIGIFSQYHYFIDADSNSIKLPQKAGTHKMVWAILDHWSKQEKAKNLLFNCIKPYNKTLEEWLSAGGFVALNHLSSDMFKSIGIDLQNLAKDHDIRDRLSYRPSAIHVNTHVDWQANYKFITNIWKHLEPGFHSLDLALLKQIIDLLDSTNNIEKNNQFINSLLEHMNIAEESKEGLSNYLLSSEVDDVIIKAINVNDTVDDAIADDCNHLDVISRAFLLLRIATGANNLLMQEASVDCSQLDFWWKNIFKSKNIPLENETDEFIMDDLWSDIEDIALADIEPWINGSIDDLDTMKRELSYATILLSEGERAMLWGLST